MSQSNPQSSNLNQEQLLPKLRALIAIIVTVFSGITLNSPNAGENNTKEVQAAYTVLEMSEATFLTELLDYQIFLQQLEDTNLEN